MPIEAIVIPIWQVDEVAVDPVELFERPGPRPRLPSSASASNRERRERTSANSAATNIPFRRTSTTSATSARAVIGSGPAAGMSGQILRGRSSSGIGDAARSRYFEAGRRQASGDGCEASSALSAPRPRSPTTVHRVDQHDTPYLDALVELAAREPGRFHIPGHKGGRRRRPGAGRGDRRGGAARSTSRPGSRASTSGPIRSTRRSSARSASPPRRGARGASWFLVNGASGGNHAACMALAHLGDVGDRPAQRPLVGDRRPRPQRAEAALRRARDRRRARRRPLPDARGARRGARRGPDAGRRLRRLADLLRRGRRRRRARRGRPRPRRAARRRRVLGRPPRLLRRAPRQRARLRRRRRPQLGPQARRQPDPVGDPPPRHRAGSTSASSTAP